MLLLSVAQSLSSTKYKKQHRVCFIRDIFVCIYKRVSSAYAMLIVRVEIQFTHMLLLLRAATVVAFCLVSCFCFQFLCHSLVSFFFASRLCVSIDSFKKKNQAEQNWEIKIFSCSKQEIVSRMMFAVWKDFMLQVRQYFDSRLGGLRWNEHFVW